MAALNRALVITSAGRSLRFIRSLGRDVSKVLYYEDNPLQCLLAQQIALTDGANFDRIVVVGGYQFESLKHFMATYFPERTDVELVYNSRYADYGTGFSLACGVQALAGSNCDEVVFMEGDIMIDEKSLRKVLDSAGDVVTYTGDLITAERSVVFTIAQDGHIQYRYDPGHAIIRVDSPFVALGNSGQVWKFCNRSRLEKTLEDLGRRLELATNLVPIEAYLNHHDAPRTLVGLSTWFNCNEVSDYRAMRECIEATDD